MRSGSPTSSKGNRNEPLQFRSRKVRSWIKISRKLAQMHRADHEHAQAERIEALIDQAEKTLKRFRLENNLLTIRVKRVKKQPE